MVLKSKTCAANTNEKCFIKLTYMRPFLKAPSTSIYICDAKTNNYADTPTKSGSFEC